MSEGPPSVSNAQQQWSSPRVKCLRALILVTAVAVLLNLLALVVFLQVQNRQPSSLPAMKNSTIETRAEDLVWNSLHWEKALWPRQAQAAPQVTVRQARPPKLELIAIVQRGNEVKAAVDAGSGMQYLYTGDQIKGMKVKLIDVTRDRVELDYQGREVVLELP